MKLGSKFNLLNTPSQTENRFTEVMKALKEKLIIQRMHYQSSFIRCSLCKNTKLKKPIILSKIFLSASNFSMQIFDMPVTYLKSVEKIQWKL